MSLKEHWEEIMSRLHTMTGLAVEGYETNPVWFRVTAQQMLKVLDALESCQSE